MDAVKLFVVLFMVALVGLSFAYIRESIARDESPDMIFLIVILVVVPAIAVIAGILLM